MGLSPTILAGTFCVKFVIHQLCVESPGLLFLTGTWLGPLVSCGVQLLVRPIRAHSLYEVSDGLSANLVHDEFGLSSKTIFCGT